LIRSLTALAKFSVLRDVEGLSTAETAASLGVSDDVVKTRLSRARGALRRALLVRAGASRPMHSASSGRAAIASSHSCCEPISLPRNLFFPPNSDH
jgi:predicted RNA polymerase sigma factor